METYIKYGGNGLSFVMNQLAHNSISFDYLDPITTIVKIGLIGHKNFGTKIGIHNHMIMIQEPWILQGIQRLMNKDDRNQLYQLKCPIIYFHGLTLGYIDGNIHNDHTNFFHYLEEKAIIGLKRLKITYETNNGVGSITTNCLDSYIEILSERYSVEDFDKCLHNFITPMIMTVYQEYIKKWTQDDFKIIEQISQSIEKKTDKNTQSVLCDTIDSYLTAKNTEIATVRPV